ncbi:MAG: putative DNA binding domain-containing protein [Candidatus Pacebacteria bacterium]|nr:putative DNA binding domain-containing protein [Candidatus Paceibacterota bacterium]
MRRIVIKEGPFVFVRNVFAMELVATAVLFGLSFLENYEQLYKALGLIKLLRYDLFLIFGFSTFQLIYIIFLFLQWYFKYYEIRDKELVRRTGFLFPRQKSVPLSQVASVETSHSPINRLMRHATILLEHNNGRITQIQNVADYEECVAVIKQAMENGGKRNTSHSLAEIIKQGEGKFIEFKQTLRWDARNKQTHKDLERAVAKTIVGFLNNDGGTLLIGVTDTGKAVGLEDDYNTLPKKNQDGFENHLTLLIKTMIGMKFRGYISVRFEKMSGNDVCIVDVEPSHKPAYLINENREEFFVRAGNSTQPYTMSEAEEYIKTRWG